MHILFGSGLFYWALAHFIEFRRKLKNTDWRWINQMGKTMRRWQFPHSPPNEWNSLWTAEDADHCVESKNVPTFLVYLLSIFPKQFWHFGWSARTVICFCKVYFVYFTVKYLEIYAFHKVWNILIRTQKLPSAQNNF